MNSSTQALRMFSRNCARGAGCAELFGQNRVAAELREAASRAIAKLGAMVSAPVVNPETARRREISRAYAKTILAGFGHVH